MLQTWKIVQYVSFASGINFNFNDVIKIDFKAVKFLQVTWQSWWDY